MVIIVTNNRTIELVSEKKLCLSLVWLICGLASCVFVSFAHAESIKDWRSRALRLQAHLDYHAPLVEATFAATHNSYLADVYYPESIPEIFYFEPIMNHNKSVKDQLEAGDILQNEFSGNDLESKLEDAGIKGGSSDASAILERLKAKKAS